MPVATTPELEAFRQEVRRFCREEFPAGLKEKLDKGRELGREDIRSWQKTLQSRRWYAGHWPVEHGGLGWSALQRLVFDDEMFNAGCPYLPPFNHYYIGPVLFTFGSKQQQEKYLGPTRDSDILWCQGYSEPGAGSDLAGLRTRAVREGDHYVVNGQKIWTSKAHWADMIFALVRTSNEGRPQDGISFLMIDMKTPGIRTRPIITMDVTHHCNEVFFDDVRVPVENLIGEEGKAWEYSRYLLSNERLIPAQLFGKFRWMLRELTTIASQTCEGGRPVMEDPAFRHEVCEIEILLRTFRAVSFRLLAGVQLGGELGAASSILKLRGAEIEQRISQAAMDVTARRGLPFQLDARQADWSGERIGPDNVLGMTTDYLMRRAASIYGGSSEIMHNIIGRAALGLKSI